MKLLVAMSLLAATPSGVVHAAEPAAVEVKAHRTLVDHDGRVLGKIYAVDPAAGSVTFMSQMRMFHVPLASVTTDGNRFRTSLTRAAIGM